MAANLDAEDIRLAALQRLDILDSPREKAYDDIVKLASYILEAPVALVTMLDRTRNWFKACVGLNATESPRDISFCAHAIMKADLTEPLIIPDATLDPRFCSNPLVTGPLHARMYVGVPLVTRGGQALGTLCVFDVVPRQPAARQIEAMKTLASSVVSLINLREDAQNLRESEERNRLVVDNALDAAVTMDGNGRVTAWNLQAEETFGWTANEAIGQSAADLQLTFPLEAFVSDDAGSCQDTPAPISPAGLVEQTARRRDGTRFPAEFSTSSICTRDGRLFSTFVRDITDRKNLEQQKRDSDTRDVAIFALARLAESRDPETGEHLERVQSYCKVIGRHLARTGAFAGQIDDSFVELLYSTSPLHDIGKVGIPDGILLKPGRLSDDEFDLMKLHTTIGAETLDAALERFPNTPFLKMAREIAASHHERFDGSGYPNKLAGENIPLSGRIVAVVDVFDALSSKRVYKEAFTFAAARGLIIKDSGTHFDPKIVQAFEACQQQFKEVREQFSESRRHAA